MPAKSVLRSLLTICFLSLFSLASAQNNALYFNGSQQIIASDVYGAFTQLSAEAWINPSSTQTGEGQIVSQSTGGVASGWELRREGTTIRFTFRSSNGIQYSGTNTITQNIWQHVAGTWDGSQIIVYVNGVAGTPASTSGQINDHSFRLMIGDHDGSARKFIGSIDEVRVWSDVRTPSEISSNINSALIGNEGNLIAYYDFNHTSGLTLTDKSVSNNDGTLTGFSGSEWAASGAAVSIPASPGGVTNNISYWLKANDGVTGTAQVSAWADQTSAGLNAVQGSSANQPSLTENALNYNPAMSFDGADDNMSIAFDMNTTNLTTFVVFNSDQSADTPIRKVFGHDNGAYHRSIGLDSRATENMTFFGGTGVGNYFTLTASEYYISSTEFTPSTFTGYVNGLLEAGPVAVSHNGAGLTTMTIGAIKSTSEFWDGNIAEIAMYSGTLTTTERQKIESYLAIKYGITISQTSATNYLASDGGIIWDATINASFNKDITVIGRDDASDLDQRQSKNQNTGALLSIGLGGIASNNASNTNSFPADDSYLALGDNGLSAAFAAMSTSDIPIGTVDNRLARVWRVEENSGDVGSLTLEFDLSGLGFPAGLTASNFQLLVDSDGVFNGGASNTVAATLIGDVVQFNNINLADGEYFTLGFINPNYALDFDGTDDYAAIPALNLNSNTVTMELWIKPDGIQGSYDGILMSRNGSDYNSGINFNTDNKLSYHWNGNDASTWGYTSGPVVAADVWQHIAMVIEPTKVTFYVNGTPTVYTNAHIAAPFDGETWIAGHPAIGRYFNGEIDEVRIWNVARSTAQILGSMDNELNGGETGLIAYYNFSDISGTTVLDEVSNTYNADLIADAAVTGSGPVLGDAPAYLITNVTVTPGATDIDVSITKSDVNVDLYYVISQSATVPTKAQILAGQDHTGSLAENSGDYGGNGTDLTYNVGIGGGNGGNDNPLTQGTSYYIYWLADDGNGGQSAISTTSFATTTPPTITLTTLPVTGGNLVAGSANNLIYKWQQDITVTDATAQGYYFGVGGSYATSDFASGGFKLWENTTDDFGTATQVATGVDIDPAGNPLPSGDDILWFVSDSYTNATTRYFYVTVDIATNASTSSSFNLTLDTPPTDNFRFVEENKVDGGLTVGSTFSIITPPENVLDFDGVDDFVTAADPALSPPMSIEFWVKLNSTKTTSQILVQFGAAAIYVSRYTQGRILAFFDGSSSNNSSADESSADLLDDQWHHIAATTDGSTTRLYIDGVLDITHNETATVNTTPLYIGANQGTASYMMGEIDEVRIWDEARTSTQILGNLTTKIATAPGLVTSYDFNKDTGTDLFDLSGNGNDGVLTNFDFLGTSSDWLSSTVPSCAPNGKFIGAVDADWSDPSNWCGGVVPSVSNVVDDIVVSIDSDILETVDLVLNASDFQVSAGANLDLDLSSNNVEITNSATFTNEGTVNIKNGTTINATSGTFTNKGVVNVQNGTGVNASSGSFVNQGTFFFEQGAVLAAPSGTFVNEGVLKGFATVSNNFDNPSQGTVAPGASPGCMDFVADFTNSGLLEVEIDGTTACTEYDQITVGGTAFLGGTLTVVLGYTPVHGDSYLIIDADVISGTFSTVNLPNGDWSIQYDFPATGQVSLSYFDPNASFALDFDGLDDKVVISDDPSLEPGQGKLTVEAWIYNQVDTYKRIITKGDGSSAGIDDGAFYFDTYDNTAGGRGLRAAFANSSDIYITTPLTGEILTLNTWHHVALVFDQGVFTIYLDGSAVSSADLGEATLVDNAFDWGIGEDGSEVGGVEFFNGQIDEVRIWHSARTPEQLIAFKDVELNGGEPGLVGYWNFSDGAGDDSVPDVSGNGNAGTLINMDNATDYVAATHGVGAPGALDVTSPSVTIGSSDAATNSPYMVDISFDEEVVNFDIDDITIINGFVEDLASSNDQDFVATVYPITDGNVSISIPALRATDLTGNGNAASNSYSY
ncbi:MAG: hypothetical protein JXR10_18390, partial [Cyclobacteriaceae bacterium]